MFGLLFKESSGCLYDETITAFVPGSYAHPVVAVGLHRQLKRGTHFISHCS